MTTRLSTLCYIEADDCYLMLHRISKKNDINKDKWIGVGGHFEEDESPDECIRREVMEETGLTLPEYEFRGIVTFVSGKGLTEYMHLFTANLDSKDAPLADCDEGVLEWIKISDLMELELWEGDKIFLHLLQTRKEFFSLKLVYDAEDILLSAVLDGKELTLKHH